MEAVAGTELFHHLGDVPLTRPQGQSGSFSDPSVVLTLDEKPGDRLPHLGRSRGRLCLAALERKIGGSDPGPLETVDEKLGNAGSSKPCTATPRRATPSSCAGTSVFRSSWIWSIRC